MFMSKFLYQTIYHEHANQELDWLPMDTKELFEENLKYKKHELEKYNWLNQKFTYKFNSSGFRSDEFSNDEGIVFLGCSFTIGIGLPLETTYPYLISKSLKLKCYNLGIGGGSNDTAFRLAYHYLPKLKTKLVVFRVCPEHRIELIDRQNQIVQLFPNYCFVYKKDSYAGFYETFISNPSNTILNQDKNLLAISMLCHSLGIKLVVIHQNDMSYFDYARDLAHPGVESNLSWSKKMLEIISLG